MKTTLFGSSKEASQLEGSKVYMKQFLKKYNIPTASFVETSNQDEANNFINTKVLNPLPTKSSM